MLLHALSIFCSSVLLFLVQPLIARFILPWFGGGASIWTACMLFFQVGLLLGYLYAHLSLRYLSARSQSVLHLVLLLAAAATLPITPAESWKIQATAEPTWRILALLVVELGIPYLVLSSTAPLLQAWIARSRGGPPPYRLYALSNAGSLLALLAYPTLVDPLLGRGTQTVLWSLAFAAFALLGIAVAREAWRAASSAPRRAAESALGRSPVKSPRAGDRLLWCAFPACASVLLLAVTNQISLNVAPVPFLWVLPLGLYLLSFIVAFAGDRWYPRPAAIAAFLVSLALSCWSLLTDEARSIHVQVAIYCGMLFCASWVCHGELHRRRPSSRYLTAFYLSLSAGGAAGGAFVALIAPVLFDDFLELHLGMLAALLLLLVTAMLDDRGAPSEPRRRWAVGGLGAAFLAVFSGLYLHARQDSADIVWRDRSFYGALSVREFTSPVSPPVRYLYHGDIVHGAQVLQEEQRRRPTTYYSETSGVGRGLQFAAEQAPALRVGLVGLGVGTLATYGRAGDLYRYYELNPEVIQVAHDSFSFLSDSPATVEVVQGDGRISLEAEAGQDFDVLVLDAFSGDSIPVHLLTKESFLLYRRHLSPGGLLAVHISNRFLDLRPVVARLAEEMGWEVVVIVDKEGHYESEWVLASAAEDFVRSGHVGPVAETIGPRYRSARLWTDESSSLFEILD